MTFDREQARGVIDLSVDGDRRIRNVDHLLDALARCVRPDPGFVLRPGEVALLRKVLSHDPRTPALTSADLITLDALAARLEEI